MAVYEVPKSQASLKQNRFEFKLPGSPKVYDVPLLKFLKPSIAFEIADLSEIELARRLFAEYLPEASQKFEDADQLAAFMSAWTEASGIAPGESKASADS